MDREIWTAIINKSYDVEFDWFAFDRNGRIAVFSSFNRGFIPEKSKTSFEKFIAFQELIKQLPKIGIAHIYTKNPGDFTDWKIYAEKGIISFDYQDVHRLEKTNSYDLIAKSKEMLLTENIQNFNYFLEILPEFNLDFDNFENRISFESMKKHIV